MLVETIGGNISIKCARDENCFQKIFLKKFYQLSINKFMNILYCLDDHDGNYTRHLAVSILSLLKKNQKENLHIYILARILSKENQQEIQRIVDTNQQNISFIIKEDIIPKNIKKVLINARKELTVACFYRLFLENLPNHIDRILYLDCDTIVNGNLKKLYDESFDNAVVIWWLDTPIMRHIKQRELGISQYINSWVLIIDVNKYKQIDWCKGIINANTKFWEKITADDQDYINIILKNNIKIYDERINTLINRSFWIQYNDSYIWHITNKVHSKFARIPHKIKNTYYHYLSQTKWKSWKNKDTMSLKNKILYPYNLLQDFLMYMWWKLFWKKWAFFTFYITNLPPLLWAKVEKIIKKYL